MESVQPQLVNFIDPEFFIEHIHDHILKKLLWLPTPFENILFSTSDAQRALVRLDHGGGKMDLR